MTDMMTFDSTHPGNSNTHPEIDAFAVRLDSSILLQPDHDPTTADAAVSCFGFIEHLQEVSTARVEEVRKYISEDSPAEDQEELAQWQLEHQTWELFGNLSSHRHNGDVKPQEMPKDLAYTSNVRFKEFLLETDAKFMEWSLILQWLQKYAPSPTDELEEEHSRYRSGWMYTKESLKSQKRMGGKRLPSLTAGSNLFFADKVEKKNLITELDPDAPSRQQKQLEAEDEEAERNFMKLIWKFIRKGDVQSAQMACTDFGELWRAASLSGGEEAWDPSIDGARFDIDDDEDMSVKGNRRRELWRRMCYAIARKSGGDVWEKAVYGALCGDVVSVSRAPQLASQFKRHKLNQSCRSKMSVQPGKTTFMHTSIHLWKSTILNTLPHLAVFQPRQKIFRSLIPQGFTLRAHRSQTIVLFSQELLIRSPQQRFYSPNQAKLFASSKELSSLAVSRILLRNCTDKLCS